MDSKDEHNTINHPNHYTWHPSGVECKDIIEEFSYHVGTAMGYLWRHEYKNGIEDLKKAVQHIQFEIERLERIRTPATTLDINGNFIKYF